MDFHSQRQSLVQLLEAAKDDLEAMVASGQFHCVEEVLSRYPELAEDEELVLELIYLEFVLQQEAGDEPHPGSYRERFPHLATRLTRLFEFEKLLESNWIAPETVAGSARDSLDTPAIEKGRSGITGPVERLVRIGDYDCLKIIGHGGMGLVYEAVHRGLNRPAALKVVSQMNCTDEKSIERFVNEARLCGSLNHPQIVQIYESGIHDGIPFFAMEFMPGGSLQVVLVDGPLEPRVASQVVRALAQSVSFAHSRSIVHRDLKPGNVLLAPAASGGIRLRPDAQAVELKISDFGLAKCLADPGTQTRTGAPIGTPAYMAPEQIGFAKSVDGRCDVYSLGAILFHLLVGKPPFQAATVIETLQLVQLEPPMSIRTLQPSVPRDLETICLKCLQKEPERRYATVDDLADDLQRFQECRPVVARPVGVVERSLRWAKRNPMAAVLVTAVLIATALTTALWLRAESFRVTAVRATLDSEESNRQTLVALRKLTETVVLKKFAKQDQLSPQDREYLKEIAGLYGQLAQLPHSSITADQIRGEGHYWSGVVYLRLADSQTAVQHFNAAIEILSAIESKVESEEVFQLINDSMELMVEALEISNQMDAAISITERRIARCQSPPKYLSNAMLFDCERSLIAGYRQLGNLYDVRGDSEEALFHWKQALAMIEAALLDAPKDFKLLNALSGTLRSIASVETDPELKISLGNRSIELGRRLAAEYPEIPNRLRSLAWALYDQAVLLKASGQADAALELVQEAIEKAQELVDNQPLLDEYRGPLAVYLGLQGELLNSVGRHDQAQDSLRRSIELLNRNLQTSPDAQVVLMQFARSWIQLLRAQSRSRADAKLIEQTRASAKAALADLRAVLDASGASFEKFQLLQKELASLEQESR